MELFLTFFLSSTVQLALAGASGGAIRWYALRTTVSRGEGALGLPVGALLAIYLHPMVGPMIEFALGKVIVAETGQKTFAGFVTGAWGVQLATFIIDLFKAGRGKLGGVDK